MRIFLSGLAFGACAVTLWAVLTKPKRLPWIGKEMVLDGRTVTVTDYDPTTQTWTFDRDLAPRIHADG